MSITAQRPTRGLVAMNGLKTPGEWIAMTFDDKAAWLGGLSPLARKAQAGISAVASRRTVSEVLFAWVLAGYLSHADALMALVAEPDATRGGEPQP